MENENNQDPSINSPHPAVAGSGQASPGWREKFFLARPENA